MREPLKTPHPPTETAPAHATITPLASPCSTAFNLGNGNGFSVQEVIDTARRVTGRAIDVIDAPRRAGDPPRLVADASQARAVLGWKPQFANLDTIVAHAWAWEQQWPWLAE